jgi:hypothetical protein
MLRSQELRIGNLVNPNVKGIILTDETVKVDASLLMVIDGQIDNKGITFEPIALTEEWLLKFGFKKNRECFFLNYNDIETFKIMFHYDGYYIEDNDFGFTNPNPIKNVHTLQNWFFLFSSEELEYVA